jgi:hypothetical protein
MQKTRCFEPLQTLKNIFFTGLYSRGEKNNFLMTLFWWSGRMRKWVKSGLERVF